jgi:hypothetical protein
VYIFKPNMVMRETGCRVQEYKLNFTWVMIGGVGGSCEHGNVGPDFMKGNESLDKLTDY